MDTAPPDVPQATPIFGEVLRRIRLAAGISQERLVECAGPSVQALSALENGRRQAPYRHTVMLLAQTLAFWAGETALLEAPVVRRQLGGRAGRPHPNQRAVVSQRQERVQRSRPGPSCLLP
jgi:transcriptional regulator with XRE-family HTH domain